MSTTPDIGYGTLFQTGTDASPETWTTLAKVMSITPPGMSRDTIDVSHEQSPGAWREFIAGMKDGGEIGIEMLFIPGGPGQLALMAEFDLEGADAIKQRRILFRDGSFLECAGILTNNESDAPLDDKMSASVTFKVSGKPTLTQAA